VRVQSQPRIALGGQSAEAARDYGRTPRQRPHQYREVNVILRTSPVEGTTAKGKTIYVNEAQRDSYPVVLTRPPSPLGRSVFFSEEDAYTVHFRHNDALVVAIHIVCYKVSKILVAEGSSVNIMYGHALDRMEDTLELTRKMIIPQT